MPGLSDHGAALRADIFCRVIDNYGDIGVSWRLARRLADGHGWRVRLWVDDLSSFARLEPALQPSLPRQHVGGVEVVRWIPPEPEVTPADVVIEAFACDPPPAYVRRIGPNQVWLNLEYLSAESWIDNCHLLPSPQAGGATKFFFFPGFSPDSGGLLREPGLLEARDACQANPLRRQAFLHSIGADAATAQLAADGRADVLTLFSYADAPASALLNTLAIRARPALLLVCDGVAPRIAAGALGACTVVRMPFLAQTAYDELLWSADLNLVRGEDSFVRAQWAGRPLIWHIYPQDQAAHLDKLDAWLGRYPAVPGIVELNHAWNGASGPEAFAAALRRALEPEAYAAWRDAAVQWSAQLRRLPELADAIADFCLKRLK